MTSTTLLPMRAEDFGSFFEAAVASYAAQNVAAGRWPAADAADLAHAETQRLLPQGFATADQHLYTIDAAGTAVGSLWLATLQRGSARTAWVYQLMIGTQHRRRGHARAALLQAEAQARGFGCSAMGLHVFAFNVEAEALYRSVGYAPASLLLHKALA